MSDALTFFRTFIRRPTQVGAVLPSSRGLAEMMVKSVDWGVARAVIEYGPGTGVFTERIGECLQPDAKFFAIERSAELAQRTRQRCPQAMVFEDSVANVQALCRQQGIDQVDAILCGLPWAAFPESLQNECFDAMLRVLRPGGQFATFAYWQGVVLPAGRRFAKRLESTFSEVQRSPTVWANVPPAFVYRCRL